MGVARTYGSLSVTSISLNTEKYLRAFSSEVVMGRRFAHHLTCSSDRPGTDSATILRISPIAAPPHSLPMMETYPLTNLMASAGHHVFTPCTTLSWITIFDTRSG